MSNIQIANQYAKMKSEMLAQDSVWISDNLPMLSRGERKAVLKVYKKYFKTVEYDAATGICKCSNKDNTQMNFENSVIGVDVRNPIKMSTFEKLLSNA